VNVLTRAVLGEMRSHLADLREDHSLRVLVLRAEGKHFSAGADVGEHLPPAFAELIPEFTATIRDLWDFPLPVIAAVRGRCLGGGFELVQPADAIVAGVGAQFGQPEICLGVFPPAACALLPRLLGPGRASRIVLTVTRSPRARPAMASSQVVPDGEVDTAALVLSGQWRAWRRRPADDEQALQAATDRPVAGRSTPPGGSMDLIMATTAVRPQRLP
jgi:cyclohexa-1,5-dienecarbonyl-CoA hydratase